METKENYDEDSSDLIFTGPQKKKLLVGRAFRKQI